MNPTGKPEAPTAAPATEFQATVKMPERRSLFRGILKRVPPAIGIEIGTPPTVKPQSVPEAFNTAFSSTPENVLNPTAPGVFTETPITKPEAVPPVATMVSVPEIPPSPTIVASPPAEVPPAQITEAPAPEHGINFLKETVIGDTPKEASLESTRERMFTNLGGDGVGEQIPQEVAPQPASPAEEPAQPLENKVEASSLAFLRKVVLSGNPDLIIVGEDGHITINEEEVNRKALEFALNPHNVPRIAEVNPKLGTSLKDLQDMGIVPNKEILMSLLKKVS